MYQSKTYIIRDGGRTTGLYFNRVMKLEKGKSWSCWCSYLSTVWSPSAEPHQSLHTRVLLQFRSSDLDIYLAKEASLTTRSAFLIFCTDDSSSSRSFGSGSLLPCSIGSWSLSTNQVGRTARPKISFRQLFVHMNNRNPCSTICEKT